MIRILTLIIITAALRACGLAETGAANAHPRNPPPLP